MSVRLSVRQVNNIQTSSHQQHYSYNMKPHRVTKPATTTVSFVSSSFISSSVLSGWVEKAMVTNLSVVPMHLKCSSLSEKHQCYFPAPVSSWTTLTEDLSLHPGLQVDGPVDDVKEDVRSRKHDPGVLVYGVGVYPNVHVASGWPHLACHLRVIQ